MDKKTDVESLFAMARRIRDEQRPSMEAAAAALGTALLRATAAGAEPLLTGPDAWSWFLPETRTMTLSRSAMADALGHPLLTIREEICLPFDNQLVSSALVIGTTPEQIISSALTLLMNHTAASAGMLAAAQTNVLDGDPLEIIDAIRNAAGAVKDLREVGGILGSGKGRN